MYEGVSSPIIQRPKTLQEFASITTKSANPLIWAGGSAIMTGKNAYPVINSDFDSIVYLGDIEELKRFLRNDRMAEFGALVSLYEMKNSGRNVLPTVLLDAIDSIGIDMIIKRCTVGGALSIVNPATSFVPVMIALGGTIELRYIKKKRLRSHWIRASQLLDRNGKINLPPNGLITRVRINVNDPSQYQRFLKAGSYNRAPEESVFLAFVANINQGSLHSSHFAVTFPTIGTYTSKDLDNMFNSQSFPNRREEQSSIIKSTITFIDSFFQISPLQHSILEGFMEQILGELNEIARREPTINKEIDE